MKPLEDIDLNLLLLLDWLLKDKSVTRAAQRVGITQSAASRSLQKLRKVFGDELLVRTGRSYTLSRFANSLQHDLATAISQLRVVTRKQDVFDPQSTRDSFVIACNDYLASLGAEAWYNSVYPKALNATVNWRPIEPQVVDLLASGGVDFVLAPYAAKPNMPTSAILDDMIIKPFLTDRFVLFAGASHALIKAKSLSPDKFADAHHVLVSPQGTGESIVDRKLRELGLKRRIVQRTWSFNLAAQIALKIGAVVVLPERFAQLYSKGRTKPLPVDVEPLPSFIAWHASRTSDPAHRWVRNQIREAF